MRLKKWWEVYSNDSEKKVFTGKDGKSGLARHAEYIWRSVDMIVKESGLDRSMVEAIIDKYAKKGLVLQNPKNAEQWGYWERVAPEMATQISQSFSEFDKQKRIDKADGKKNVKVKS